MIVFKLLCGVNNRKYFLLNKLKGFVFFTSQLVLDKLGKKWLDFYGLVLKQGVHLLLLLCDKLIKSFIEKLINNIKETLQIY